ncbi:uncharacterized protein DUF4389 [Desulfobotulus alkaliphilus]|uniref:Uncharacterized protein DUF4389 n=1 Tax=Desulfobotulus alkaliphilus TaxID=622671 RepID=A0A562S0W6_9BACT|nr:DUF4389 domain-containing protein [Desulfobotulus alkaliphilus]TWI74316.1 uncharacterized protein DUF4389 [Desulfobotulus alkaliphilus]
MDQAKNFFKSRKDIAIRLLYTIFFFIVFEFLKTIQIFLSCVQYIWVLVTLNHLEPLRTLTDRLAVLSYRILRYISLNENKKPFPFTEFPESVDVSESVRFSDKD